MQSAFGEILFLLPPSQQDDCNSALSGVPAASLKAAMPTYKNVVVTYTAIDGDKALVNVTGPYALPESDA